MTSTLNDRVIEVIPIDVERRECEWDEAMGELPLATVQGMQRARALEADLRAAAGLPVSAADCGGELCALEQEERAARVGRRAAPVEQVIRGAQTGARPEGRSNECPLCGQVHQEEHVCSMTPLETAEGICTGAAIRLAFGGAQS